MNVARTGKVIDVLLVEDDPGDVLMTREAFEDNKVANRLAVVSDGVSALAYLRKEGEHADARTPGPGAARPQPAPGWTGGRSSRR